MPLGPPQLIECNDKPDGRRFSPAVIIKALLTLMVVGQRKRRIPLKETCNCWASFKTNRLVVSVQ